MEYVFGADGSMEVLKTKGGHHTDLSGFHQIERTYPDQTITDNFRAVRKLDSKEDVEGNCYDWYEIDHHYRYTDKSRAIEEKLEESSSALEDAMCEQDAANDERISALEDAVCELDKLMNE